MGTGKNGNRAIIPNYSRTLRDSVARPSCVETACTRSSSVGAGGQQDPAQHGSAVAVDRQMYGVVGVETHQLDDAAENLPQSHHAVFHFIFIYW